MAEYQQLRDAITGEISSSVLRRADNATIPDDPENRDRQEYEAWLVQGNTPDPPAPLPETPPPEPLELPAHPENPMDATTKEYVDNEIAAAVKQLAAQPLPSERA